MGQSMAQEVGRFFRDLRYAFGDSQAHIAHKLATRVDIIVALERGDVRALPPWPETCRIVRSYAALAGLDPRPALHSIEMLLQAQAHAPAAPQQPRGEPMLASAAESLSNLWHSRVGQAARLLIAVSVPVALIVLVTQTSVLEAAVAKLPPSVKRIVRGAQNYVIVQFAPVRDGMRWIDVPDPRTRRGDKLPDTARSD
jgi:cytoskeletal protein RodZ